MILIKQLLLALVTIYIVDISGFTQSWRSALTRMLGVRELRELKPFDCSTCMTWWVCIFAALFAHQFNIYTVAFAALLSLLSVTFSQALLFVRESTSAMMSKLLRKWM